MISRVASTPRSATSSVVSISSRSSSSMALLPSTRLATPSVRLWRVRARPDLSRENRPLFPGVSESLVVLFFRKPSM